MVCLNSLPVELLHHVCIYLNCKDVLELSLANRYFSSCLYSNLFQNVIIRSPKNLRLFFTAIDNGRLNETLFGLKTKTFKLEHTPINAQQLNTLLYECPHITELDVDNIMWLHICPQRRFHAWNARSETFRRYLNTIFTRYTNLTYLSLNLTGYTAQTIDIFQVLPLLPGLSTLKLLHVFHLFTMDDMEKIHTHCPRLLELTVSGFCLNRTRPTQLMIENPTLRHLSIEFASGWSYYYNWLWYIGRKYTGLSSVTCECTSATALRSSNPTDDEEMMEGFTVFAQQHALTLQKLELINLTIDERFIDALRTPNTNDTTDLMRMDLDDTQDSQATETIGTATVLAPQTTAMTNARFSNHSTLIRSEVFLGILQYVQHTIRTLNISWPSIDIDNIQLCNSLVACTFLTDLTIELPRYTFGLADGQGTVPFDRILRSCPLLTSMRVINGRIFIVDDDPMVTTLAQHRQPNYPLKKLVLESVSIPASFMVMENHGLVNLEHIALDHCAIYGLARPTLADPGIMLDWLFPVPELPNGGGGDDDTVLALPRRSLSVSVYHTRFMNPDEGRTYLFCDYLTLSQYGKGEESSWSIRRSYVQKMVRMSSPMLRRKSGQLKRKNNRRQAPSEITVDDASVTPNVGILISCHSMDSLRLNGRELL